MDPLLEDKLKPELVEVRIQKITVSSQRLRRKFLPKYSYKYWIERGKGERGTRAEQSGAEQSTEEQSRE